MINDAVSKAIGSRMKRLNLEEQITAAVQKTLAATQAAPAEQAAEAPSHGEPERLNLKTIDARFKAVQEELARERQARQAAEQSATQTRLRNDLQNAFAKHAGSDNPHLQHYLNSYLGQFKVENGVTYHSRKDEFGSEEMVPLDVAAEHADGPTAATRPAASRLSRARDHALPGNGRPCTLRRALRPQEVVFAFP
jgi:hypothetical protein